MKYSWILIGLLGLTAIMGCGIPDESDSELSLNSSDTQAFPFSIKSCTDEANGATTESLTEASADFGTLNFRWFGKASVTIKSITVTLHGNSLFNSSFSKVIGSTELEDTFVGSLVIPGNADPNTLPPLTTTGCSVRVGGIKFKDPSKNGFATGTITLFGITDDGDGNKDVVVVTKDISIKYYARPSN